MLTIGQLAAAAGTTVRAVRHYHAKGLLIEPERDASGYRRYGAAAVVELVRIRVLADAGVPLSRVGELLTADDAAFAAGVAEVDRRLRREIRARQHHRERIARLAAGDSLALPPEAVAYLGRMRELGFSERLVGIERDSWILLAAQMPERIGAFMAVKRVQIEDDGLRALYRDVDELADSEPDDARLPALADRVVALLEAHEAYYEGWEDEHPVHPELVALLDAVFLEHFPWARRLLALLEDRGFIGWTDIRRKEHSMSAPGRQPTGLTESRPSPWLEGDAVDVGP